MAVILFFNCKKCTVLVGSAYELYNLLSRVSSYLSSFLSDLRDGVEGN